MYWCSLPWQMCTTCATCCMLLVTRLYRTCEKCTKCAKSCVQWQLCDDALAEFYFQGIHYLKLVHNMYNTCAMCIVMDNTCAMAMVWRSTPWILLRPAILLFCNTLILQYSNTVTLQYGCAENSITAGKPPFLHNSCAQLLNFHSGL